MSEPDPRTFYTERIPSQFNRALTEQRAAGADGAKLLGDMETVNASMRIVVKADNGGTFILNIEKGVMSPGDAPIKPPFLTLIHDGEAFVRLEKEAGDSALGFLGGLAGLAGDIRLTQGRLDNLAGLSGSLLFTLEGDDGFALLTHFGEDAVQEEPACRINVGPDAYAGLKTGEMNPQDAFMTGQIAVEGDMQMAMQLALAVLAPD